MKSEHAEYRLKDSVERINQILRAKDSDFEDRDSIPLLRELTFTNGFFVKCSALSVDIRCPSKKTGDPVFAKLYRACVSEVTAVMNGNPKCAEVTVAGFNVSGIFDTPFQEDIDDVFSTATKVSSMVDILNHKCKEIGLKELTVGIGLSYGKALVVMAGCKGSGGNEVVWMGDVIGEASRLASYGNKDSGDGEIMVSEIFYYNLGDENRKMLTYYSSRDCFHGNVVNAFMNNWYKQNCI